MSNITKKISILYFLILLNSIKINCNIAVYDLSIKIIYSVKNNKRKYDMIFDF